MKLMDNTTTLQQTNVNATLAIIWFQQQVKYVLNVLPNYAQPAVNLLQTGAQLVLLVLRFQCLALAIVRMV